MAERRTVSINYRGQIHAGEWYVENAMVHLVSPLGERSRSIAGFRSIAMPSELAERMLWELARANDPRPRLFFWK